MNPKNCSKYAREDWILRAAGDVSKRRRLMMERHSADCPQCAAIQAETDALFQRTQTAFRSASPPSGLDFRLWRETGAGRPVPSRRLHLLRGLALGTIVAASIAGGAALLLPGSPLRPIVAFAQVEKAMGEIQIVRWRSRAIQSVGLRPDGIFEIYKPKGFSVTWARLDSPILSRVSGKNRMVYTPTHCYQIDDDASGVTAYARFEWGLSAYGAEGGDNKTPREILLSNILFPKEDTGERQWKTQGLTVRRTPWRVKKETLSGRSVLRFDGELQFTQDISKDAHFRWKEIGTKQTIWVDPDTYRIIERRDSTAFSNGKETVESVGESDDFQYNVTPPTGVFAYQPPVGQRFSFRAFPERRATDEEDKAIRSVFRRAADAVNAKDAAAYTNQWDFDYLNVPQDRREAEKRAQRQKMMSVKIARPWRINRGGKAVTRPTGIFLQETLETPFPPAKSNEFLAVAEMVDANGKIWIWKLNLRKEGGDFRIVRADFWPLPAHGQRTVRGQP